MFDLTQEELRARENLRCFLEGEPVPDWSETSQGGGATQAKNERMMAEMDALEKELGVGQNDHQSKTTPSPGPQAANADGFIEKIYHEPKLTAYDRARSAIADAEARISESAKFSPEWKRATDDLLEAKRRLETELQRDGDDGWRKRRRIDEHRAGDGREAYNASRRKVRPYANADRQAMSAEERELHDKEKNADRKARHDARKKLAAEGMSGEALEAAVDTMVKAKRASRARKRESRLA